LYPARGFLPSTSTRMSLPLMLLPCILIAEYNDSVFSKSM
jgi:hypothetical protein